MHYKIPAIKTAFLLLIALLPVTGFAQKAYESALYSTKLQGKLIRLTLANGYIGASKIRLSGPAKTSSFLPDSSVADKDNRLVFRAAASDSAAYFILSNMQEVYEQLPATINGQYYSGEKRINIKFHLIN